MSEPVLHGVVASFDEYVGLGVVQAGRDAYPFHCTQIADRSRSIEPGTEVSFVAVPRYKGRVEAYDIQPVHA